MRRRSAALEVIDMCHEWWSRREREREERLEQELRFLLAEERERHRPAEPVLDEERDEEPERLRVESATR